MADRVPAGMVADEANGPAYRRVKDHVLSHILAGDWVVGDRIPSEHELKNQFGVSRMTVHRALRELTEEGYVSRTVGAGTFVADRRATGSTLKLRDINDEARDAGRRCRPRHVGMSRGAAGAENAARLGIRPGSPIFCVTIVRWLGSVPVQLEERWVNATLVPSFFDHDLEREAPAAVLARLAPDGVLTHEVRAVAAKGKTRTLLAMQPGEPCLLVTSTLSVGDAVLSVADLYHPGSRYALPGRFL